MNKVLEAWCRAERVPYFDTLPLLVGKDISALRKSETDIHFTDVGHRVIGTGLVDFFRVAHRGQQGDGCLPLVMRRLSLSDSLPTHDGSGPQYWQLTIEVVAFILP